MSFAAASDNQQLDPSPPGELRDRLESLRVRMVTEEPAPAMEQMMTGLCEAVDRIGVEHAGMAQELLAVYEQLGAVFEVTRRLPGVQREAEVIDLFVDSLRRSFAGREVHFLQGPALKQDHRREMSSERLPDWLEALVRQGRERRSVQVAQPPSGIPRGSPAEAMVGSVFAGDAFVGAIVLTRPEGVDPFRASDMLVLESLTLFCGDLIRNHRLVRELREMSIAMVRSLVNAVDQKDEYTSGHSLRVGYYATLLGNALGLRDVDLQMLQWSALLHDVGKIGIRDAVLKKEGKLTDEEFQHIKEHPVRSHKVVQQIPQLQAALDGVLYHHERYNGNGYPSGLKGDQIPLQARIIQIADVFDALTSNRSYRPAFDCRKALEILKKEAGETVDPQLQQIFDRLLRGIIEPDPEGWAKLVARANAFAQVTDSCTFDVGPEEL